MHDTWVDESAIPEEEVEQEVKAPYGDDCFSNCHLRDGSARQILYVFPQPLITGWPLSGLDRPFPELHHNHQDTW